MKHLWKLSALVAAWGLFALGPAPIRDLRPGVKLEPEKSEAQRAAEQQGVTMKETGGVEPVVGATSAPTIEPSGDTAKGAEAVAAARLGSQTVVEATKEIKKSQGSAGGWRWLWALLLLAGSFGLVQAFKVWANKNLPDMPTRR